MGPISVENISSRELSVTKGITEKLKTEDQTLWVQRLNNIPNKSTEIVNAELIYA